MPFGTARYDEDEADRWHDERDEREALDRRLDAVDRRGGILDAIADYEEEAFDHGRWGELAEVAAASANAQRLRAELATLDAARVA